MIIVGIDMSKNSPGVCINTDDEITFMSFIRGKETKRNAAHFKSLTDIGIKVIFNDRSTNVKEYTELEVWKIQDASLLADTIVESLPDEVDIVAMEGFSYGSKGNAGLDIAGYAYCVRKKLFEKYGTKIAIFSPGAVKKMAGKGNAGKEEMLEFFKNNQLLSDNAFHKGIKSEEINSTTKPVDDLIDSYYVQACGKKYFEDNR